MLLYIFLPRGSETGAQKNPTCAGFSCFGGVPYSKVRSTVSPQATSISQSSAVHTVNRLSDVDTSWVPASTSTLTSSRMPRSEAISSPFTLTSGVQRELLCTVMTALFPSSQTSVMALSQLTKRSVAAARLHHGFLLMNSVVMPQLYILLCPAFSKAQHSRLILPE